MTAGTTAKSAVFLRPLAWSISAPDQDDSNNNASNKESNVSGAAQRNQIRLVDIDANEQGNQSKEPNRNGTKRYFQLIER
jgi:hypothetical protein